MSDKLIGRTAGRAPFGCRLLGIAVILTLQVAQTATAADDPGEAYRDRILPDVIDHCYACHADGQKKGNVSLDLDARGDALLHDKNLWWGVLKNVRAGIMPPAGKPKLDPAQKEQLVDWIKRGPLGLDPSDPDPGRVTIRRLNRVEYRNTVHDLLGAEYDTEIEFPPDDTGYGFDTVADVLTVSPLLLEKYLEAAEKIVAGSVPTDSRALPVDKIPVNSIRGVDARADKLSVYTAAKLERTYKAKTDGTYRVVAEVVVRGEFEFDPGRCRFGFSVDGKEVAHEELAWQAGKTHTFEATLPWQAGSHALGFALEPLTPAEKKVGGISVRVASVRVEGPLEREKWGRPANFDRFFSKDVPADAEGRRAYARDVLGKFALKAYRRPVESKVVDRLVAVAEETYQQPGKSFEQGVARAITAVLASPRFLFRIEEVEPADAGKPFGRIDEYALASRLSYFLWSTMPDDELFKLAAKGELRKNLPAQVKRLLEDYRSDRFVRNFVGQWLQARDVETVAVDARSILARDEGYEKDLKREQDEFRVLLAERAAQQEKDQAKAKELAQAKGKDQAKDQAKAKDQAPAKDQAKGQRQRFAGRFPHLFGRPKFDLDGDVRKAMRRETELVVENVVHEDRSVLELLDSDSTYLNEKLANFYGVKGVKGVEMRRVKLPADSPRGGLLTQGTFLVVTSNPTRTSPVKRGLFILDNILGTPAPPPPAAVPPLEDADKAFQGREPTLRESMEVHRAQPLCNACHARMDPLGLALENFDAMGLYRSKERGQAIDAAGTLLSGETFAGVRELKRVLKDDHRGDFYRCLTEKLLTYGLGRGLEATDVESVDRIVAALERENGKFSVLLTGLIDSAPFQKRRNVTAVAAAPNDPAAPPPSPPPTERGARP